MKKKGKAQSAIASRTRLTGEKSGRGKIYDSFFIFFPENSISFSLFKKIPWASILFF